MTCPRCHRQKNDAGRCKGCKADTQERYRRRKGPAYLLYELARQRAKRKGVPFTLRHDDIQIPLLCPVLGIMLEPNRRKGKKDQSNAAPSLDRFYPELGYIPGNVAVISRRANVLKNSATEAELLNVLTYLRKRGSDGVE